MSALTSEQEEILTIAQEECAEIVQAICKGRRFGFDIEYDGATNRQKLTQETGDFFAMAELMIKHNIISLDEVLAAKQAKFEKLKQWSSIVL